MDKVTKYTKSFLQCGEENHRWAYAENNGGYKIVSFWNDPCGDERCSVCGQTYSGTASRGIKKCKDEKALMIEMPGVREHFAKEEKAFKMIKAGTKVILRSAKWQNDGRQVEIRGNILTFSKGGIPQKMKIKDDGIRKLLGESVAFV